MTSFFLINHDRLLEKTLNIYFKVYRIDRANLKIILSKAPLIVCCKIENIIILIGVILNIFRCKHVKLLGFLKRK